MKTPLVQMALPAALSFAAGPAFGALGGKFGLFKNMSPAEIAITKANIYFSYVKKIKGKPYWKKKKAAAYKVLKELK